VQLSKVSNAMNYHDVCGNFSQNFLYNFSEFLYKFLYNFLENFSDFFIQIETLSEVLRKFMSFLDSLYVNSKNILKFQRFFILFLKKTYKFKKI